MSNFRITPSTLCTKRLLLPNGHRTSSDRICRIVVDASRSLPPDFAYVTVFETTGAVFEGLVELDSLEENGLRRPHQAAAGGNAEVLREMESSNADLNQGRSS